jgi:hypothetical protein
MITPDGPLGFQVSATDPDHEMRLIGHFSTLAEAEAFADSMRQIDGGQSYSMGPKAIGLTVVSTQHTRERHRLGLPRDARLSVGRIFG